MDRIKPVAPQGRRTLRRFCLVLCCVLGLSLAPLSPTVIGANSITYLGKPAHYVSTNSHFPIDNFHKARNSPVHTQRATLIFLGTLFDRPSAVARWAVVKALDQFGTFSHATTFSINYPGHFATFDLSHARYHSRYVAFDRAELLDAVGHLYQKMTTTELRLYDLYARQRQGACTSPVPHDIYNVYCTEGRQPPRTLPVIYVGGYVETYSQIIIEGDFEHAPPDVGMNTPVPEDPLSPDEVRAALVTGKNPPLRNLVEDVNAEANIMTAFLCHADHLQPRSVCGRTTIRSILHYIH